MGASHLNRIRNRIAQGNGYKRHMQKLVALGKNMNDMDSIKMLCEWVQNIYEDSVELVERGRLPHDPAAANVRSIVSGGNSGRWVHWRRRWLHGTNTPMHSDAASGASDGRHAPTVALVKHLEYLKNLWFEFGDDEQRDIDDVDDVAEKNDHNEGTGAPRTGTAAASATSADDDAATTSSCRRGVDADKNPVVFRRPLSVDERLPTSDRLEELRAAMCLQAEKSCKSSKSAGAGSGAGGVAALLRQVKNSYEPAVPLGRWIAMLCDYLPYRELALAQHSCRTAARVELERALAERHVCARALRKEARRWFRREILFHDAFVSRGELFCWSLTVLRTVLSSFPGTPPK